MTPESVERALMERPLEYAAQAIRSYDGREWSPIRYELLLRPENDWSLNVCELVDAIVSLNLHRQLDRRVVTDAIEHLAQFPDLTLAVNICALSIDDMALATEIGKLLVRHGVQGERLSVEITEVMPILDASRAEQGVRMLQAHGVSVGLDDLGTGCNGFSALFKLPFVDYVKLDGQLIADAIGDSHTRAQVSLILEAAAELGLDVVVEGIETTREMKLATTLGVHFAQGFLWDLPATRFRSVPDCVTC